MSANQSTLTLSQYLDLIGDVPLPSQQQKEYFIDYVSQSHSWYKHLKPFPPGEPFYFYIDKYAGFGIFQMKDGTRRLVEREEKGFHYADLPTHQYRSHFGHLAYSNESGTTVLFTTKEGHTMPRDKIVAIPDDNANMVGLPSEILRAGEAWLTGVIHVTTLLRVAARWAFGDHLPEDIEWPEESGGRPVLRKILEYLDREMQSAEMITINESKYPFRPSSAGREVDSVLYELLEPERQRLRGEMMKAIDRVCDLIASNRRG